MFLTDTSFDHSTLCIWLQIKHAVSLVQSSIEQQQLFDPWLVWKGIDSILSGIWQIMHYLCCTKDLLNSDTGSKTRPAYFVLSRMLLSAIRADLQSPFHKAFIYRLKWHMQLQGHCFSPQSNWLRFLPLRHGNKHTQEATFFLTATYLIELNTTSGSPLKKVSKTQHTQTPTEKVHARLKDDYWWERAMSVSLHSKSLLAAM